MGLSTLRRESISLPGAVQRPAHWFVAAIAQIGGWTRFSAVTLFHCLTDIILHLRYRSEVWRLISDIVMGAGAYVVGGGMIFVVAILALFVGGTVGVQAFSGLQSIGAQSFTGLAASYINTREITPLITAIALSAQVGASFTAEIGAMRVSEEIDALDSMSVPSITYLVSTRVIAMVIALVPLYLVALFASFFATRFVSTSLLGLSTGVYDYYFHLYLPPIDIFYSVCKVVIFSVVIVLVHCYYGYYADGGPAGVGVAVGRAIRSTTVWIILINLLLSYLFWGGVSTVSLTG